MIEALIVVLVAAVFILSRCQYQQARHIRTLEEDRDHIIGRLHQLERTP